MISNIPYSLTEDPIYHDSGIGLFLKGDSDEDSMATLYEYDNRNNMVKTVSGKDITTAKYNGDGLRVEKTVNGEACRYLYEYDKIILEVGVSGTQTARNVYGMNLLKREADGDTFSYMYNGHGDVTALLNQGGTVAVQYYYDAFGNVTETTNIVYTKDVMVRDNNMRISGLDDDNMGYLRKSYTSRRQ